MPLTSSLAQRGLPDYDFSRWTGNHSGADFDFRALANALDCTRDFNQAGIIYADGSNRFLVRPSRRHANNQQSIVTHVVITKVPLINQYTSEKSLTYAISSPSLGTELTSTAFSCGAIIVNVLLAISGGLATPLTGGTSGLITAIGTMGAIATTTQCITGGLRIIAISQGYQSDIAWLDSHEWYNATMSALDVISLAGAGAGLKTTVETYRVMKSVSSRKAIEWLKSLNRAERRRITETIIRAENPGISGVGIKAAFRAGKYPKRFPTESIQRELYKELARAINNTSAFVGSALTGSISNPGSLLKSGRYVIGTIQSLPLAR
ncbi:hypothetical protein RBA69_07750 [Brenneria goodwinii]|uniref:hypothetical protein n=1 Tax=Brenneria goodwinii TaxID=1109412 RepID=UPI0036ED3132